MTASLKLMCVLAHPDDESMGTGGILARYAAEGVDTYLVCATRGERGWRGLEADYPGETEFGQIREKELLESARILGLKRVDFLDYIDGDLDKADHGKVVSKVVALIREVKPQVVVSFGHDGGYGHPDHIAICQFATAACVAAANAEHATGSLAPHQVDKLYYMAVSQKLSDAYHNLIGEISIDVDGVKRSDMVWPDWTISARIKCDEYWQTVWRAIRAHRSQTEDWDVSSKTDDDLKAVIEVQEFYRAYSLVNGGRELETDLFVGLR
jgi:LmbE family N-acetylglucosaminyl deacetylase